MPQFVKHFVQDLTQDIKIRQCGTIVFNGDNLSNVITVDLFNGTEPYSGGGSVSCSVICPDGATVPITNGSISGNTVTVTLTGDCFALPGQIGVSVQVVNGDIRTTILKAIYNVELLETDTIVDPGSRITASVGQLVSDIEAATAEIPASDMASLMAGIAPTFSASINYNAGAYVYYNGTLYRFTADHAAGSWTGTDATAVALGNDLGGQVSDLKSAIQPSIDAYPVFYGDHIKLSKLNTNPTYLNVYNADAVSEGHSINQQGGYTTGETYFSYCVSEYIKLSGSASHVRALIYTDGSGNSDASNNRICFYDESHAKVGSLSEGSAYVAIPDGAVYVRCAFTTASKSRIMVFEIDNSTFNNSNVYSAYLDGVNNGFEFTGTIAQHAEQIADIEEQLERIPSTDYDIIFWGDSLTAGAGGNGTSFPKVCKETLGITNTLNAGVGGETANTISARQGGNSVLIPAGAVNGTYTKDALVDAFGVPIHPLRQGNGNLTGNTIYLNGIQANIAINQSSENASDFTYTISGYPGDAIAYPQYAYFAGSRLKSEVTCIFVGTNGAQVGSNTDVNARIAIIKSMISHLMNDQYIVMGLSIGTSASREADDLTMLNAFGNHFFQTGQMLVDNGLTIAGITPTAQDTTDIAEGKVPTSLRSDSIHLNADGYTALGKMIASKIRSLGYLESFEIVTQPENVTVATGSTATFTVVARGVKAYQWQYSYDGGTNWSNNSGDAANTAMFAIEATSTRYGYKYRCRLTDMRGAYHYTDAVQMVAP